MMELLTKKELAEHLKISEITVNRYLAKGMPKVKIGNLVRFELEEVLKWLKEGGK